MEQGLLSYLSQYLTLFKLKLHIVYQVHSTKSSSRKNSWRAKGAARNEEKYSGVLPFMLIKHHMNWQKLTYAYVFV